MSCSTPLPSDHPLMIAWNAFKETEEYANNRAWAAKDEVYFDGALWAAFLVGAQLAESELATLRDQLQTESHRLKDERRENVTLREQLAAAREDGARTLQNIIDNPLPGDELGGPKVKVKVLAVTRDENGVTKLLLVGSGREKPYVIEYAYEKTHEAWRRFVTPSAEVLRAAIDAARAEVKPYPQRNAEVIHGKTCEKRPHSRGSGYLHEESDDGPYEDEGLVYCGRCHVFLRSAR